MSSTYAGRDSSISGRHHKPPRVDDSATLAAFSGPRGPRKLLLSSTRAAREWPITTINREVEASVQTVHFSFSFSKF
ncbi:hypothetical protein HanRHA438_Chr16g0759851 [Helianthus annuus]|nr:hypothetical protein HanRHA438_Chr16g0759851 [Helianthus annuus]